jgi:hypothetical protein
VAEYLPLLPWVSGQVSKPVPKESESAYFFQVFSGADAPAVVEHCYKRNWYSEKLELTSSYGCGSSRFKNSMTCLENLDSVLYCLVRNFQLPRHSLGKGVDVESWNVSHDTSKRMGINSRICIPISAHDLQFDNLVRDFCVLAHRSRWRKLFHVFI